MTRTLTAACLVLGLAVCAAPAGAQIRDLAGAAIPNTGVGANPEAGYGNVAGAPRLLDLLAVPFDPEDPADATAAGALGSPGSPEDHLGEALDAMAAATTPEAAAAGRQRALDILEGNPVPRASYSGIPLLNWNAPLKAKTVPANGTVEVRQVRWGEHMITDTWLLRFEDPAQPFKITYRVTELGAAAGGQLNPAPLLADGATPVGGQHSAVQPLNVEAPPDTTGHRDTGLATGTSQGSRFTEDLLDPDRTTPELDPVPEQTRNAVQQVTVAMPPPRHVRAILDPNMRRGHEAGTTLMPATAERVAAARAALGFSDTATDAENMRTAIGRLSEAAPEKQIWSALDALPAKPDATGAHDPAFLDLARAAGEQNRALVGAMRSRTALPAGTSADATADATVVLQNNEAYLTRRSMRLAEGGTLRIQVVNRDAFAHRMTAFDLHGRQRIFGAEDWGQFQWGETPLAGGSQTVGPGEARTFTVTPTRDAFAVWVGDLGSGDQADAFIQLDRRIRQEKLEFGSGTLPVHSAPDADANVWVTLSGVDTIARIRPGQRLEDSAIDRFPLPGGRHEVDSAAAPLAPADITVDGRGMVWASLASGNAIARIDPGQVADGTSNGITIVKLDPCPTSVERCRPEVPPVPNEEPTRRPTRLKSLIDGQGHTVLWFVEQGASGIGVLRVSPTGEKLDEAHFPCTCLEPESLDLGPDGSVWYTQVVENRIGRLRPDPARPYSESAVRMDHYDIPGQAEVFDAAVPGGRFMSSLPLSIAVDGRSRVWFSESAMSGVAWLDPAQAVVNNSGQRPGTVPTRGITEIEQPGSDFRSPAAPADVTVDRSNTFWWAGEYGDQIEQVKPDGQAGVRLRGSVRRGLTEGPVADVKGNLWVVESGGNLINRITGVTEGPLRPFGLPAAYEANVAADAVSGTRLRDAQSVEVRVSRGDTVVASADVPVQDGSFDVSGAEWQGSSDPVRPDDTVRIQPRGPFARAALSFRVADLRATVQVDGSLAGTALSGGRALADRVRLSFAGGEGTAAIDGADGSWRFAPASPLPRSATGTVAWSGATVAGTFRTVNRFTPPASPPPPASQPQATTPPAAPPQAATAPAPQEAQAQPPAPSADAPPPGDEPGDGGTTAAEDRLERACTARHWLFGDRSRPTVLLLGMSRGGVEDCIGRPSTRTTDRRRGIERWRYGRTIEVTFRRFRVDNYALLGRRFATSHRGAGVGSSLTALRRDVPGLRSDPRTGEQRAVLSQGDRGYASLRVLVDRRGRVRRIETALRSRSRLDPFARGLLRGGS